jgi:hypothetical protein
VDEDAQLLVAKSAASATLPDEVDLHFSHLTAYGRITLKNLELGEAKVRKAELIFGMPVVGEWYWGEDGTLTSNGASHTITLSTDASGDLWFACAPVSVGNTGMTLDLFTDKGNLRKEITFPEGRSFASGKVARFSIDMAGIEPASDSGTYTLVTDSYPLAEGDEIIFLNADGKRAMGSQDGTYRSAVTTGFVLSGSQVKLTGTEVAMFTVEAGTSSGTWSFKGQDGYLAAPSADKNQLLTQKKKDGYASWNISFAGNGDATVEAMSGSRNLLRYNSSSPRFSCYRSGQQAVRLYRKGGVLPVADDPLAASDEYGCYLSGAERTYVKGSDQIRRSYGVDGKLVFALLNAGTKEQLVISGYDPSLTKGEEVTVTVSWRKGLHNVLKEQTFRMRVIREDGSKVWLGNGSGQGFIIKK